MSRKHRLSIINVLLNLDSSTKTMKNITLDTSKALQFLAAGTVEGYESKVKAAQEALENGTCEGNDFLGWLHLPTEITNEFLGEVQAVTNTLREKCEVVVVAGIGGSYLGARAVIEALGNSFAWLIQDKKNPTILFAGNNIGEDYLFELTEYLKDKKFGVINISKSGTTTETALTFRLLKKSARHSVARPRPRMSSSLLPTLRGVRHALAPTRKATRASSSPTMWADDSAFSPPWDCCPSLLPASISRLW